MEQSQEMETQGNKSKANEKENYHAYNGKVLAKHDLLGFEGIIKYLVLAADGVVCGLSFGSPPCTSIDVGTFLIDFSIYNIREDHFVPC